MFNLELPKKCKLGCENRELGSITLEVQTGSIIMYACKAHAFEAEDLLVKLGKEQGLEIDAILRTGIKRND